MTLMRGRPPETCRPPQWQSLRCGDSPLRRGCRTHRIDDRAAAHVDRTTWHFPLTVDRSTHRQDRSTSVPSFTADSEIPRDPGGRVHRAPLAIRDLLRCTGSGSPSMRMGRFAWWYVRPTGTSVPKRLPRLQLLHLSR